MSRLASGLSTTGDDALKALVASGDTSVPGVELSDLNDGDILARTRERVNSEGQMQFVYIPDDGSDPIESDWIQQEHKKKVILGWTEGVKNAIISRGQAGMQAANQAALEERLRRKREEDMGEVPEQRQVVSAVPQRSAPVQAALSVERQPVDRSDPGAYVEDQLEITRERLKAAELAQQDILREVLSARRDYEKWKTLAAALGGGHSDIGNSANGGNSQHSTQERAASILQSYPATTGISLQPVRGQRQVPVDRGRPDTN